MFFLDRGGTLIYFSSSFFLGYRIKGGGRYERRGNVLGVKRRGRGGEGIGEGRIQ